jgi:multiple sugar transport system permease protein
MARFRRSSQSDVLADGATYQALIYSNFSFTVPFTVWMMVGYFSSIPRDLEESAMIDGCNHFGALCRIVLPLAAPGIAATAIFAFVVSWSELLFAISFTTETSMRTLSAGLLYMVGQYEVQWGPLSAGVILSTVPVAVLFSFLQRHLIHGLTAGAVKGYPMIGKPHRSGYFSTTNFVVDHIFIEVFGSIPNLS